MKSQVTMIEQKLSWVFSLVDLEGTCTCNLASDTLLWYLALILSASYRIAGNFGEVFNFSNLANFLEIAKFKTANSS